MKTDIPKPKCYLVCGEAPYEPHKFEQAKVFLVQSEAEEYKDYLLSNQSSHYIYPVIIELDLLVKHQT